MDYEKLLTDNLAVLQQVVRNVARQRRMREDEAEDLLGAIQLKLVENDYDVLRRFERRASLRTYLTIVVIRHVLDQRNAAWGKWRPSVHARRNGPLAVHLEKLITRDGLAFDEAVQILRTNHNVHESEQELYELTVGFPGRTPRRFVDAETLKELPDPRRVEDGVERVRRASVAAKTGSALKAALAELDPPDRLLLKMYFQDGLPLARIAQLLQVEAKPLYRRKDQVLARLATALEREGISRADIADIAGEEIDFDDGGDGGASGNAA